MRFIRLAATLCGATLGVTTAWSAPGDFDLAFGDAGKVRAPFERRAVGDAIARQPDGKLVAAGVRYQPGPVQVVLVRFLDDGSVDSSFGSGGIAAITIGAPTTRSILIQADGKIVVVGSDLNAANPKIFLARFDAQGVLDPGFGTGGITITPIPGAQQATKAVMQADGKVVVATAASGDVLVLRYTDGSLDPGYGTGGIVTLDFAGLSDSAAAIVLDGDGVVVLASASDSPTTSHTALARLDSAGVLDPSFGSGGTVLHQIEWGVPPETMVRLSDGKLFVSAGAYVGEPAVFTGSFFARFDPTGAFDPTFGTGGVLADASEYAITNLAVTPDGKILGTGSSGYAIVLERFALDGSHDPTFGDDGEVETALDGNIDYVDDVVVYPDGKIAVTGNEYSACTPVNCDDFYHLSYRFYVARFHGGTAPCASDGDCGPCESCGEAGACVFGPRTACVSAQPRGATLQVTKDPIGDDLDRYRIKFKWRGATPLGFDPVTTDDVGMCIYFDDERVLRTVAPAGGLCAGIPCWKGHPGAFGYRDRARSSDGIAQVQLKSTKASVDASGVNLTKVMHDILNPAGAPVLAREDMLVQVHGGNGQCLQATVSDFRRKFRAIAPGQSRVASMRGVGQ